MEQQVTLTMTVSKATAENILAALTSTETKGTSLPRQESTPTSAKKQSGKVTKAVQEDPTDFENFEDDTVGFSEEEETTEDFTADEETEEVNISDEEVRAAMNKITQKQGVKGLDKYLTKLCKVKARPKIKDITQEQRQAVVKFAGTLK